MSERDPVAALIPWYVRGSLDPEARERVEEHLPGCDECGELLEAAAHLAGLAETADEALLDHVQAQHLDLYARAPAELEAELRGWIESHLGGCALCRETAAILESLPAAGEPGGASGRAAAGGAPEGKGRALWDWLSRTLLHPVPAAAYLLLLLAGLVLLRPGGEEAGPRVLPAPLTLWAPDAYRGEGVDSVEPLPVPLAGDHLFLEIQPDLDEVRLGDPATFLRVELLEREALLWSEERGAERLGEYGAMHLLVPTAGLSAGRVYRIRVTLARPGDPLDGEALLDQPLLATE
jgi:hypothetical protein